MAPIRLGMLTPSSNTVLEPVTNAMLAGIDGVSAHFSRFRVTQISMDADAQSQFTLEPMLAAADLLADAKVDCICWNGTSSGWLGFEQDAVLCEAITARTGVPACSAIVGLNELFALQGVKRFGLVSPYTDTIQDLIIANYARHGMECVADQRLQITENFAFGTVTEAQIEAMCRAVASARPDALAIYCTNMAGGRIAPLIEQETGVPVFDTVAVALWASLRAAGGDPGQIKGWGRLFGMG
jgi:maleate isomerase